MPTDLDDYEIDGEDEEDRVIHYREDAPVVVRRRRPGPLLAVAAVIILSIGGAATYFLTRSVVPKAEPHPPVASPPPVASAAPETPAEPLPSLAESDAFVRDLAARLSAHPQLAQWLARTGLIRTLASVVASIAIGETPRRDLDFLTPAQRFRAAHGGTRVVADPAGYVGYDVFADVIASIDARAAADAYRITAPLFQAAYQDLGFPGKPFRAALDTAIRELLAVPVPSGDADSCRTAQVSAGRARKLESLTQAQKQFLRIGPRNVALVQAKLREMQAALTTT